MDKNKGKKGEFLEINVWTVSSIYLKRAMQKCMSSKRLIWIKKLDILWKCLVGWNIFIVNSLESKMWICWKNYLSV